MEEGFDRKSETKSIGRRWDLKRREYKCADGINIQTPNGVFRKVGQEDESNLFQEDFVEERTAGSSVPRNGIWYRP